MEQIRNQEYGGERPLFATHDLQLEDVTIRAGESALKECSNIIAINCRFEGKYPFWHTNGFIVKNCLFTEGARAALWYSQSLQMADTLVEAPKMFRVWMTAVTPAPSNTADHLLEVRRSRTFSSLPPDIFANASPIICIPYRNNARPPTMDRTSKISIFFSYSLY